jgi:2-octaprenyl-3-methyl-6-methoxy-1,4-benzoquinol hydroxylase
MSSRATAAARRGVDAVVVGAGVVGAATALALARGGRRVALVEARAPSLWDPAAARDLRVFALAPASIEFLQHLDAWPAIRAARAHGYRSMRVWDAAGGGELAFRADELGIDSLGHIVEQAAIQHALWQQLQREPGIALHCPARVVALQLRDDGAHLELDDGAELRAPLALAADGADSTLRTLAALEVSGRDYAQRGIVCYVETDAPHADTAWQRFLPSGPLALLPCDGGLGSIVWTVPEADASRLLGLDDADFGAELTRAFDARLGEMRPVSGRAAFPLRLQLARRYVRDRVVLIGDAAHVVHPLAGQGVNLGLQDGLVLLDVLEQGVAAGREFGAARDLRRYERARRSDNALAAYGFDALSRAFSNQWLLPTLLRGPALGLVDRIAPLKRFFARRAIAGPVR